MGYHGESLTDIFSMENMAPPTERLLHAVADDAGDAFTERAAAATPEKSGTTAASWRKLPVVKVPGGFESGTTNPHWIARFLEYGVEAHLIGPKTAKALDLPDGPRGGVSHPGIRARHMTAVAATEVEAMLPALAAIHLARWQSTIEGGASQTR